MEKEQKTNAMRLLEKAKISFRTVSYEVDENDLSGVHVAAVTGLASEQVFKTLVVKGDKTGYLVACIPVAAELDLKKLASVSGNKKAEMIQVKELLPLTGYIRGGCSPVGMKKKFPTFMELSAEGFEWIAVSAGVRGMQMILDPKALVGLLQAKYAEISRFL